MKEGYNKKQQLSVDGQVFIEERSPVKQWTSNCNSYNIYVLQSTH